MLCAGPVANGSRTPPAATLLQRIDSPTGLRIASLAAAQLYWIDPSSRLLGAVAFNSLMFAGGANILLKGLSLSGIAYAFGLGTLVYASLGWQGWFTVALYFVIGTAVTRLKLKDKEFEGIAEKKGGRRGLGSILGSALAAAACAMLSYVNVFGPLGDEVLRLGFATAFATKLSDTVSSEVGKAFGKTTYLVTNFKIVPRGTEGAVSVEGTAAGVAASALMASVGLALGLIPPNGYGPASCIAGVFIANYVESIIGATLQERPGYEWLTNDVANVMNTSLGALLAMGAFCALS